MERGNEITSWLKQNGNKKFRYVVLDDDTDAKSAGNWVQTFMSDGLTRSDVKKAIKILNSKQGSRGETRNDASDSSYVGTASC